MAYATMLLVVETAGCGHSSSDTDQVSFTFNGRAYSLPPAVMGLSRTPSEVIAGRLELVRQLVAGLHRLAVIVRDDPDLDHRPTRINANSVFSEPRSLAVARSEIEARHRNCPLDRGLSRKYSADPVFAVHRHPMVMHDPVYVDHDLGQRAGHRPTHSTATFVGLVDLAWLVAILRGGRTSCHRWKRVV